QQLYQLDSMLTYPEQNHCPVTNSDAILWVPCSFPSLSVPPLHPDAMSCIKTARRPINGLPARSPFAGVMTVRRCVESQSCNNGERVTFSRVDGDPFARAALAVAAEFR